MTEEYTEQEVVRPQVDAMEDLAWNPAFLEEFERQERLGIGEGHPGTSPAPLHQHTPQLTTAQRRANQKEQPRDWDGKFAEKPGITGKQIARGPTSLKRVKHPARPAPAPRRPPRAPSSRTAASKKTVKRLPTMEKMQEKPFIERAKWLVAKKKQRVVAKWQRWKKRKLRHLKAFFSLRG